MYFSGNLIYYLKLENDFLFLLKLAEISEKANVRFVNKINKCL